MQGVAFQFPAFQYPAFQGESTAPPPLEPSNDVIFYIALDSIAYITLGTLVYVTLNQITYMPAPYPLQSFRVKLPSEENVLTFNMTAALTDGNLLVGTPTVVSVTCIDGGDPDPEDILNGSPALDETSTLILVPVKGGIPNERYIIEVNCGTNQPDVSPSLAGILPIGHP